MSELGGAALFPNSSPASPSCLLPLLPVCSETGWRVRMLTRYGGDGPSVEQIRAGWKVDDKTVVVFVDPSCEHPQHPQQGSRQGGPLLQAPALLPARLAPAGRVDAGQRALL